MSAPSREVKRWWLAPLIGTVIMLTAVGGLVARNLYQEPGGASAGSTPRVGGESVPAAADPGDGVVRLAADADAYPLRDPVRQLLQTFFDSINTKRYQTWRTVVTTIRLPDEPEQKWLADYRSTRDGSIVVYRIDSVPQGGLRVLVGFTSTQDSADAPADFPYSCIRWHVVWPLTFEDNAWKVDAGPTGKTPQRQRC